MSIAYACYNKNKNIRMQSSSGGLYYAVAELIINQGGVVYAAVYDKFEVIHKKIDTIEYISESCGSKYAQSKLSDCYSFVKNDLINNLQVLFIGTPCQCYGLKAYLNRGYDNLFIIDFACHGVPSAKVLKRYLDEQKHLQPLENINMRDKSSGWSNYKYSWRFENTNEEKTISQSNISFMKGFTSDLYLRPSCYECSFKGIDRKTDVTLGDYWGVWDIQPDMDDNKGTSLVIIHSSKGQRLFEKISGQFEYKVADIDKAISYNPSIIKTVVKTPKRAEFFKRFYLGEQIDSIVTDLLKLSLQDKVKSKFKSGISKLLGR